MPLSPWTDRDRIRYSPCEENVSQHDAASAEHGDGFAREHRAKRYMITAHSSGASKTLRGGFAGECHSFPR